MKKIIFSLFTFLLLGCSDKVNKKTITADSSENKMDSSVTDPVKTASDEKTSDNESEMIQKWTWNENITIPSKSSISNPKYSSALLLKTWTWGDDNNNQPVLTFEKDSLNIHGEKKYIYTIVHDSLRIFTSYDHPGDGFTRGIITKLTKDSLVINWSTDEHDINRYVPMKSK